MVARYSAESDKAALLLRLLLAQHGGRLLLFFDNLESLQEPRSLALTDDRLTAWIAAARSLGTDGLILLLTSRWRLPEWPEENHWPLEHARYGDFLQMARLQLAPDFFKQRDRLWQVYRTLHGNGRGLEFFAAAIQGMSEAEEEVFLEKLAQAETETQADMALARIIEQLQPAEWTLLARLPAYNSPVPAEGIIKLALDLPRPEALLAVSLVERQYDPTWQVHQYQCAPLVSDWLAHQADPPPTPLTPALLAAAAEYQHYLYRLERPTVTQAIITHQALRAAGQTDQAAATTTPPSPTSSNPSPFKQEIGDKSGEGTTLNNISQIYDARGDYDTALSYLQGNPSPSTGNRRI
jgi:hypothetical protein